MSVSLQSSLDLYPFPSRRFTNAMGRARSFAMSVRRWIGLRENTPGWSLWLGFALVVAWGVISLGYAYERSLARVNDCFNQGFVVVGRLDAIVGALDRLNVNQQAFLSTGDDHFLQDVWESARSLDNNIAWLDSFAARNALPRAPLTGMSRAIKQVLKLVGESYDVRDMRGRPAARAFFAAREATIAGAKSRADELTVEVTKGISDRIRTARGTNLLLEAIRWGLPIEIAFGRAVAFANSARLSGRAGTVRHVWTHS
jgi:CHASE3 domain sensor protein